MLTKFLVRRETTVPAGLTRSAPECNAWFEYLGDFGRAVCYIRFAALRENTLRVVRLST